MCPECMGTAALMMAGATSTSGLTAFALGKLRPAWLRRRKFFNQARVACRSAAHRHAQPHIYHRGQLSVYLGLLDVPVPVVYGPTADENPFA
jgi:hypothetical protein